MSWKLTSVGLTSKNTYVYHIESENGGHSEYTINKKNAKTLNLQCLKRCGSRLSLKLNQNGSLTTTKAGETGRKREWSAEITEKDIRDLNNYGEMKGTAHRDNTCESTYRQG